MGFKKNHISITKLFALLLSFLVINKINAQHDSLILNNGDVIVGEIKSMDRGVLTIGTDYSKNDFAVNWSGIKEIYSKSSFLVTLADGRRINGTVQSVKGEKTLDIIGADGQKTPALPDEIVFLKGLKSDFWSRMRANVDLGLSFTKANDLRQFTLNSAAGYLADRWQLDGYFDVLKSAQDSVTTTKRTDAGINYKYFLQKDWYLSASINFLSNTEQALDLRTTGKLGAGRFLKHTNQTYWTLGAGLSYNNESFTNETPSRNSLEAFAGTELNMFDIGDFSLLSSLWIYPSLTESGRWRTDFAVDAKYNLPLNFYIKMGLTLNYDNEPAIEGKETDYILGFSIGWDL